MSGNAQKTPFAQSLNRFAEQKVLNLLNQLGHALPCTVTGVNGSIVTVKFDVVNNMTMPSVTMPVAGSEWVRLPLQMGTRGMTVPSDAYLGGASGLGGGNATAAIPANLSALVFMPIGSAKWSAPTDPRKLELYGPDGVIIRDEHSKSKVTLSVDGVVIDVPAGAAVTINGNVIVAGDINLAGAIKSVAGAVYTGNLTTAGDVVAGVGGVDSVTLRGHIHSGVQGGGGNSNPPVPNT